MVYRLTESALNGMWPGAPPAVIREFVNDQGKLDKAGITHTRTRLAYALAQLEHESGGFKIPGLKESTAYSRQRAKEVWPSRRAQIDALPGSGIIFQKNLMNAMYGNRMGNRPGTDDGFNYIGRGGVQWTGRDGYAKFQELTGLPALANPDVVSRPDTQADGLGAFWTWKQLSPLADTNNFKAVTKKWNGGLIGYADREARLAGNQRYIDALVQGEIARQELPPPDPERVKEILVQTATLEGAPPTPVPPKSAIDDATKNERRARTGGGVTAAGGAGGEGVAISQDPGTTPAPPATTTGTGQPSGMGTAVQPNGFGGVDVVFIAAFAIGVVVMLVASYFYMKKKALVHANWF